jgi:hypothetical protein
MAKIKKTNDKKEKNVKKTKAEEAEEEEHSGGASLDDAFADDDDVEYAPSKPKKEKKGKKGKNNVEEEIEEAEEEVEEIESAVNGGVEQGPIAIKASKPVVKVKKGDRIRVDGKEYTVDQHYVLIDHGATKEMAIEIYDKDDKDYQIRYFNDQVETTMEFYELQEIMFIKKRVQAIEW